MIKKSVTSIVNLETGEKDTRDYYFNLNKGEALELELMEQLQEVGKSTDPKAIVPVFRRIIHYAYGVRLPSGEFTKDPEKTAGFLASDAYSELFLGLLADGEAGVNEFINQVLSFPVGEIKDVKVGGPAEQPKRPEPQDYKKSAREIAAEAAASKVIESDVESKKVPELTAENDPEYLAWKRAREERANAPVAQPIVSLSESAPVPPVPTLITEDLTAPSAVESHNAFENHQPLRRDLRDQD